MANNPTSQRGVNNTAFSPDPDIVAQLTGTGQPTPGTIALTVTAAAQALGAYLQKSRFISITTAFATSATLALTAAWVATPGAHLIIQINNDAGGVVTTTFSTGFRPASTSAGTASKAILFHFVSDGTTWNEVARSSAALT